MMKTYKILFSFFLILMSGLGFSQSVPSYVPTSGLVGWWGFNGNAQDGSGNGNHGTIVGSITNTTDRFGIPNSAYFFNGNNCHIPIPSLNSLSYRPITYSAWVIVNSYFPITFGHKFRTIIGRNTTYVLDCGVIGFWADGNPVIPQNIPQNTFIFWRGGGSSGTAPVTSTSPPLNQWVHVVYTQELNGDWQWYMNGLLSNSGNFTDPLNYFSEFRIGGCNNYDGYSWNDKLDDIGIWNRALTPQEITNLYNSQLPTQTSLCLPTITTSSPSSVGVDTVVIGGDISNDGGSSIVLRGVCYSTSTNPNMGNQRTEDGSGIGSFNTVLRGLTSSTTYYARSYAKNSNGVVVYGNEVSFTTTASLPGVRCPGTPTVTDIDGNIYNTVQIGGQCWTQSNLKVSKYRNGDSIPTGLSNSQWSSTSSGAYAIYNNDPFNDGLYGKLYNHYAVADSRGLCPTGWHLPSDGEWNVLVKYLDPNADTTCHNCFQNIAGGMMKNTGTQLSLGGWFSPNVGATNQSGFTGLPGGGGGGNSYGGLGGLAIWWSTTYAWGNFYRCRTIFNDYAGVNRTIGVPTDGFSVRCLKNTLPQVNTTSVTNVTSSTALVTGEVISEGGDQNTTRGFCYSTTSNPTISNDTTMNGTGIGVYSNTLQNLAPSTTYYVRAYATNSMGTSYGNEVSFTTSVFAPSFVCGTSTVSDADNNSYNTVQIGTQCWTQSNLKVSKYRNGDNIPTGLSNSAWENTTSGAYAIYNNDPVNDGLYGKLYNHYAATDSRGLCPTGWHVPTDSEWNVLVKYLDPNADTTCANCMQSSIAGGSMKSTATQPTPGGWHNAANTGATNSSGFTGLPGGVRVWAGYFLNLGFSGNWWSSSVALSDVAWQRNLDYGNADAYRYYNRLRDGFSVRCARD